MEIVLIIVIRVLVAAYIGLGGWMTARVLQRAGLHWWWAIPMWTPMACWVIPGAEIAGLLAAPVPVILTWVFAYAEWPALIDVGRIGRRSRIAEPVPERLSERARSHTFFAGMDEDDLADEEVTGDEAAGPGPARTAAADPAAIDPTAPHVRRAPPAPPAQESSASPSPAAPPAAADAPVLRDEDVARASGGRADTRRTPVSARPTVPPVAAPPDAAPPDTTASTPSPTPPRQGVESSAARAGAPDPDGTGAETPGGPPPDGSAPASWMLSGFDDQGRVVRYQVRADAIRACDDGYIVGRNPQVANLVVTDDSVSRRHARLRLRGERLLIEDLDSANGTWVNGRALSPHRAFELAHGASIELGGVKLTLTVA